MKAEKTSGCTDRPARPGYRNYDPGVNPVDWTSTTLGSLLGRDGGSIKTGPFGTLLKASEYSTEGVPIISVGEIGFGTIDAHASTPMAPPAVVKRLPEYRLEAGDIVFGRKGAVDRSGLVKSEQDGWFLGSDGIRLRLPSTVDPAFVALQFQRDVVQKWLQANAIGTTMASLNQDVLRRVHLLLAPLHEQRAIAAALSDVDALIGALDQLIAKKRAIKLAAMQQLLTGKTRLPGFGGAWTLKRMSEIVDVDPENLSSATPADYSFNYISLEQVDRGRLFGYSEEVFSSAPSRARRVLRADDVLMSTVRPNLMGHLLFDGRLKNAVCSTGFAVLRSKSDVSEPWYVFAHLFGQVVNRQIDRILAGSNYPAINSRDVKMIELPWPTDYSEQIAIAAVLSDMDAEITALERRRDKTQAIKQGMMQALLTGRVRLVRPGGGREEAT